MTARERWRDTGVGQVFLEGGAAVAHPDRTRSHAAQGLSLSHSLAHTSLSLTHTPCALCVREKRERERVCVCEGERERKKGHVFVCVKARDK